MITTLVVASYCLGAGAMAGFTLGISETEAGPLEGPVTPAGVAALVLMGAIWPIIVLTMILGACNDKADRRKAQQRDRAGQ